MIVKSTVLNPHWSETGKHIAFSARSSLRNIGLSPFATLSG
jgi:hypothetical protein